MEEIFLKNGPKCNQRQEGKKPQFQDLMLHTMIFILIYFDQVVQLNNQIIS